jgi:hypothetical protein
MMSLFVIQNPAGPPVGKNTGPLDALFCGTAFPNTVYDFFSLETNALYGKYEACLTNVATSTKCVAAADENKVKYATTCTMGSQGISLSFSFHPSGTVLSSSQPPSSRPSP